MAENSDGATNNNDTFPVVNVDKFSSAMYLDQLPTTANLGGNAASSSSINPSYLTRLESSSADVSTVAPWSSTSTTYWSPPPTAPKPPESPVTAFGNEPTLFSNDASTPIESTNVDVPPTTLGMNIQAMEVPGTKWVVWKERKDASHFGIYNRFDARERVARHQVPPKPIDPNNPEGTFVSQTFFLSDDIVTVYQPDDEPAALKEPLVNGTTAPHLTMVDPTKATHTVSSLPGEKVSSETASAYSAAPLAASATMTPTPQLLGVENSLEGTSVPQTFFSDDDMPYESGSNTTSLEEPGQLSGDPTANDMSTLTTKPDSMAATSAPIMEKDTTQIPNTKWMGWSERKDSSKYSISNRYEARERKTPKPFDPNDVSGESSVTQTFFLRDDIAFEPGSPLSDDETAVSPEQDSAGHGLREDAVVDRERKPNMKDEATDLVLLQDQKYMRLAIALASTESARSSYPGPSVGAVLTRPDGFILGKGFSNYKRDALRSVLENAGLAISSLSTGWNITWPSEGIRNDVSRSTLYITLEPSAEALGTASPPNTQLIELAGISRVVIGTLDPIPQIREKGIQSLTATGIQVIAGTVLSEECNDANQEYIQKTNTKLQRMAREHYSKYRRPLGFIHDDDMYKSTNAEALPRMGDAFGQWFNRNVPNTDLIWANESFYTSIESDSISENSLPWYGHADAYLVMIPPEESYITNDGDESNRFADLEWLATSGVILPAAVERIVVVDAVDLKNVPIMNGDSHISPDVNIEAFWVGRNRKPTRIILKGGGKMKSHLDAQAATAAAQEAMVAATQMASAMEAGNAIGASDAVEAAIQRYRAAQSHAEQVFAEFRETVELRRKLESKGVIIDVIEGGRPIEILNFIATTNNYRSVIWRGIRCAS